MRYSIRSTPPAQLIFTKITRLIRKEIFMSRSFPTVASVAEGFVLGLADSASASNLRFDGPRAYSYSTCIAAYHGSVLYITSRTFSSTTEQHKGLIYSTARRRQQAQAVVKADPDPDPDPHPLHGSFREIVPLTTPSRILYILDPVLPLGPKSIEDLLERITEHLKKTANTRCRLHTRTYSLGMLDSLLDDMTFLMRESANIWDTYDPALIRAIREVYWAAGVLPPPLRPDVPPPYTLHSSKTVDQVLRIRALVALDITGRN